VSGVEFESVFEGCRQRICCDLKDPDVIKTWISKLGKSQK
jgi:hypothetical protein